MAKSQRDSIKLLSPPWLATGNAERYMYLLGLSSDALLEKLNQAVLARMPGQGTPTALPFIGADRLIPQGIGESSDAYATRLRQAFDSWQHAGMRRAVIAQIAAYLQLANTSAPDQAIRIVGGSGTTTTWSEVLVGNPAVTETPDIPLYTPVSPINWDWDGSFPWWRAFLVLALAPVAPIPAVLGTTGAVSAALVGGGVVNASVTTPITITTASAHGLSTGHQVTLASVGGTTEANGTWIVDVTSPTAFELRGSVGVNAYTSGGTVQWDGFALLSGMQAIATAEMVGRYVQITGTSTAANGGLFQVVRFIDINNVLIANAAAVFPDANNGSLGWSEVMYPQIGPAPVIGTPGLTFGDASVSVGLNISSLIVGTVRDLLRLWKSAPTFYPVIIFSFQPSQEMQASDGAGTGNPDGTWSNWGTTINGLRVAARVTSRTGGHAYLNFDSFCDGTGVYENSYQWIGD